MTTHSQSAQWEYYVEYIIASADRDPAFVQQFYPGSRVPIYAVQSAIQRLNELGDMGWEMVMMQPVKVGSNGDILMNSGDMREWTNVYLCSFKRHRS